MKRPIASLAAVGDSGTFGAVQAWSGYITAAKPLVVGARALAACGRECAEAHALISGFATEALLKSVLAHAKVDLKKLRSGAVKHDLNTLWERAAVATSLLTNPAPDWLEDLNAFHNSPYVVRYMEGVNFYVLPRTAEVQAGIESLLHTALLCVRGESEA